MHHMKVSRNIANHSQYHNISKSLVVICILTSITTAGTGFELLFHYVYLDRLLTTTLLTHVTKPLMFHYYPLHKKVPILDFLICHPCSCQELSINVTLNFMHL